MIGREDIRILLESEGLSLLGVVRLASEPRFVFFEKWLAEKKHGEMAYLEAYKEQRRHPQNLLPGANTAIIFGLPYYLGDTLRSPGGPRIAQYARLRDYHKVMRKKGESVLRAFDGASSGKVFVDTAPLLEKALAARSAEGFIGRNTLFIHPKKGSYFLLGEIFLTAELEPDNVADIDPLRRSPEGGCGSCRRCEVHCPTGALSDYSLDATKCLAYYTIEHRGPIPGEYKKHLGKYVFGCDICQLVCPYNRHLEIQKHELRFPETPPLSEMATMSQEYYEKTFGGTPMTRAKRAGLQRNAQIALSVEAKRIELPPTPGGPANYRSLGKPITQADVGLRIDVYLARDFLFHSRSAWQSLLREKKVHVGERSVKSSYLLRGNDEVSYFCPQVQEPAVNKDLRVLWEKDGIIAVLKPSNLPMHEGGAYRLNTFCQVLKDTVGPEWAPTHRLDRETSGLVLCADTQALRNELSESFRQRTMEKMYYAIACGLPEREVFEVDQPLGETKRTSFRLKHWVIPDGAPAQTLFRVKERSGKFTLLEVFPKTGRTHQIRVHASWSGLPLVGDKKYYPDESIYLEYLDHGFTDRVKGACIADRLCLHAASVRFIHPLDGKSYEVSTEVPADMKKIWDQCQSQ
ncbi:MAG: tRNA epoxyqueuosine(34) reductase QueG [Deltaproteobacteria bacterium]|nr:tRNA epoxyqueuosine(34) reductase QueG [Deltaproteobacteria bacterium]